MSWHVASQGKAGAVRQDVATKFEHVLRTHRLTGPEYEACKAVAPVVDLLLGGYDPKDPVKVMCSGSQVQHPHPADPEDPKFSNDFKIDITPFWGWIE